MTAITFDAHQFIKDLQAKGFQAEQAEGISDALKNVLVVAEIATTKDIKEVETTLRHDIQELRLEFKAEIAPLKWGIGICAAGIVSLVVKAFF
jgi:UDP-N-acetylenolpyruvoylglucosamine reductase